jgi:hypothetical protein
MVYRIKQAVFIVFLLLLILPVLQHKFRIVKMEPLGGSYIYEPRPVFSKDSLILMRYQKKYEQYVNEQIGFREFFLRCYNQVWFSLFRQLHARDVILGKNYCLYERNYIEAYTGANFIGEAAIDEQLRKARFLQDTLAKMNKHLILFFAPGKGSFYPENIPDKYLEHINPQTNYKYYVKKCRELGLNYFDMNAWFVSQKNKTPYPIFSNIGIHWTIYGVTMVFDTLTRYMGHLQGKPLPQMVPDYTEVTNKPREMDDDIEKGLNLLFDFPHPDLAYPQYYFEELPDTKKPSVLTIGDSFWWSVYGRGLTTEAFNGSSFWFYNQLAYFSDRAVTPVEYLDIQKETERFDFVIVLSTEANLGVFGYDYIEQLYNRYTIKKGTASNPVKTGNN